MRKAGTKTGTGLDAGHPGLFQDERLKLRLAREYRRKNDVTVHRGDLLRPTPDEAAHLVVTPPVQRLVGVREKAGPGCVRRTAVSGDP